MATIIDRLRCSGCGTCAGVCSSSAINRFENKYYAINTNLCVDCGACREVCLRKAIAGDYES